MRRMDNNTGRVCVTCGESILPVSSTHYVHADVPDQSAGHLAQPKLDHPMDLDPFAGFDSDDED